VRKEFVPAGTTVNATFHVEILKRLRARVQRVRPDIASKWKLHHDNAPCLGAWLMRDLLAKFGVATLPPPHSPDSAPADFSLFPKTKRQLKGHRFALVEAVQAAATRTLNSILEKHFKQAFLAAQGSYFENY